MSTAAMTIAPLNSLLERLDVRDDLGQLLIGHLTTERRHDGAEAGHDLRLGIEDRLADVVLVDLHRADVRGLLLLPDALPRGTDAGGAGRRVAGEAALVRVDALALRRGDVGGARLARRGELV